MLDKLVQIDGNLLIGIQHTLNADWLTPIMKGITFLGEVGWAAIAMCLVLIAFKKTRKLGLICAASVLLTFICCNGILKPLIDRARPWETFAAVNNMLPDPGDASFPSGHASNMMAAAFSLWLNTRRGCCGRYARMQEGECEDAGLAKTGRVSCEDVGLMRMQGISGEAESFTRLHSVSYGAVVLALFVGLSRLYLGMHYPSDVIVGMLVAVLCCLIVYTIYIKLEKRRDIIIGE